MKNLFLFPTDKPSRVLYNSTLKSFCIQKEINGMFINDGKVSGADFWSLEKALNNGFKPHNIYIISDEEIKVEDSIIDLDIKKTLKADKFRVITSKQSQCWYYKKIILTTDQDLINDGVQAITDEFLEWFVKNPNCEEVIVENYHGINTSIAEVNTISGDGSLNWQGKSDLRDYRIKIPKEEPKQEKNYSEVAKDEERQVNYKMLKSLKKYSRDELLAFGKSCFYKGFEKAEKDDANCYTAFREEIESLIKTFEKN